MDNTSGDFELVHIQAFWHNLQTKNKGVVRAVEVLALACRCSIVVRPTEIHKTV